MTEIFTLQARWAQTCGSTLPWEAGFLTGLMWWYGQGDREYHTIEHIKACFNVLDRVFPKPDPAVEFALWYHDCVYFSQEHTNEERSAEIASRALRDMGYNIDFRQSVSDLILATKHNVLPQTENEKIVVDVDLSILGEDPKTFDTYEKQIREEYAWVPEDGFRAGRIKVLEGFLDREWIYSTPEMRKNGYEGRAQENLRRSLAALGAPR